MLERKSHLRSHRTRTPKPGLWCRSWLGLRGLRELGLLFRTGDWQVPLKQSGVQDPLLGEGSFGLGALGEERKAGVGASEFPPRGASSDGSSLFPAMGGDWGLYTNRSSGEFRVEKLVSDESKWPFLVSGGPFSGRSLGVDGGLCTGREFGCLCSAAVGPSSQSPEPRLCGEERDAQASRLTLCWAL